MAKKNRDIFARVLALVLLLLAGAAAALQAPRVQRAMVEKALSSVNRGINGEITFSDILVTPFNTVVIKGLTIIDSEPYRADTFKRGWPSVDTLFSAGCITATLTLKTLFSDEGVNLKKVRVDDAQLNLVTELDPDHPNNMSRIFNMPRPPQVPVPGPPLFTIGKVEVNRFHFTLRNFKAPLSPYCGHGMIWDFLDLTADARGHDLKYAGNVCTGICDACSAVEHNTGYVLRSATGRARVGMGMALVEDFVMYDDWSHLVMPTYIMRYDNAYSFLDFIHKVRLEAYFDKSEVSMKSITAFTGVMPENEIYMDISHGHAAGPLSDLDVTDLVFRDFDTGVRVNAAAALSGIPDFNRMNISADLRDLSFTTGVLPDFLAYWIPGLDINLDGIAPGVPFNLSAKGRGRLDDLNLDCSLRSPAGQVGARATVRNLVSASLPPQISAEADVDDLDLGVVTGLEALGRCSLKAAADISLADTLRVALDSVKISSLEALGYGYSDISIAGLFDGSAFDGAIAVNDPAVRLNYEGRFAIPSETSRERCEFTLDIPFADLKAIKLDKRDGPSEASASIRSNLRFDGSGYAVGRLDIKDLALTDSFGRHEFGNIGLASTHRSGVSRFSLDSDFARIRYNGDKGLETMPAEILRLTAGKSLPSLYRNDSEGTVQGTERNLKIHLYDTEELLTYLAPGLFVEDSTDIYIGISGNGDLGGYVHSDLIAMGSNFIKDASIDFDNLASVLKLSVAGSEISAANLSLKDPLLTASAKNDDVDLKFRYIGKKDNRNHGEIYVNGNLRRENDTLEITAHPLNSQIIFDDGCWVMDESVIKMKSGNIDIDGFRIRNGRQNLSLSGGLKPHESDTIRLDIKDFDLDILNAIVKGGYGFDGNATGKAALISPTSDALALIAGIRVDSLRLGGIDAGDVMIGTGWDDSDGLLGLHVRNRIGGMNVLDANAYYAPKEKTVRGTLDIDKLDLSVVQPFTRDIFSSIGGHINGKVNFSGTTDRINVTSSGTRLDGATLTPAFTGVTYTLNGPFSISSDALRFENAEVRDTEGGSALINGGLVYDHFHDIRIDASVLMRELLALNKDSSSGSFYGKLHASGNAQLKGPFNQLQISGNIITAKTGNVHVALTGGGEVNSSNLLTFKEPVRELSRYETMLQKVQQAPKRSGELTVDARLTCTPGVKAVIELDNNSGNVITVSGSGTVHADIRPSKGVMNLNGQYDISEGNLHFSVLGSLVAKDFSVENGSAIKFNGDILKTQFDINTTYSLKTSLSPLLSTAGNDGARRDVNCGINLSDNLQNPRVAFSIDIPDLDPGTKTMIEGALNTEDKVQKQFVALLLTGTFIPDEQSGVYFNNNSMLYSNLSDIMSGQLNNILQKLDIPLDLGLNYIRNDVGTDIFDVAVSTQLFNNQVMVNGSLGNRQYGTSRSDNDLVGNIDIEVKLDNTGQLRLNLFSHAADSYTSFIDNSQKNGIGLTFRKEYTKFPDIFRGLFRKKDKVDRRTPLRMSGMQGKTRTITIDDNE